MSLPQHATQADLNRINVQMAWQHADALTPESFEQLCRVTVEQLHREAEGPSPDPATA